MGRLTLARSLGVIALIGLALAAIRNPGPDWAAIFIAIAAGLLALAGASLIRKRGRDAGLIGFVVGGGSYFVATVLLAGAIGPMPVTTSMLDAVASRFDPPEPVSTPDLPQTKSRDLTLQEQMEETTHVLLKSIQEIEKLSLQIHHDMEIMSRHEATYRIGQSLLSLVIGLICGGIVGLASRLFRRPPTTLDLSIADLPPSE